ncbi:uncharacterized protein LOC108834983 isoform X1 [Raphanus sativus]|uniref:Uncharacterized protein LOC108834983 isoform X1 n=2 Tax=Raphanus sativus TaxID=3726 RepID=A0A9W3CZ35_RAPSA|nr:uncharacterized protein LOC108834983 isoform X1 [Raphanus sativus]
MYNIEKKKRFFSANGRFFSANGLGDENGDLGLSMVSQRWDPGIGEAVGLEVNRAYEGGSRERKQRVRLNCWEGWFDPKEGKGILGRLRKSSISLQWITIGVTIKTKSKINQVVVVMEVVPKRWRRRVLQIRKGDSRNFNFMDIIFSIFSKQVLGLALVLYSLWFFISFMRMCTHVGSKVLLVLSYLFACFSAMLNFKLYQRNKNGFFYYWYWWFSVILISVSTHVYSELFGILDKGWTVFVIKKVYWLWWTLFMALVGDQWLCWVSLNHTRTMFLVSVFFWLLDGLLLLHCIDHEKWYWNKITGWRFFIMAAKVVGLNHSFGRMVLNWFMVGDWYRWNIWTREAYGTQQIRYVLWILKLIKLSCDGVQRDHLEATEDKRWNIINSNDLLSLVSWCFAYVNGSVDMSHTNHKVTVEPVENGGFLKRIGHMIQDRFGPGDMKYGLNLIFMETKSVQRWHWRKGQKMRYLAFRMEINRGSLSPQFSARWSFILFYFL